MSHSASLRAALLATALLVSVAACGGDPEQPAADAGPASTSAAASSAATSSSAAPTTEVGQDADLEAYADQARAATTTMAGLFRAAGAGTNDEQVAAICQQNGAAAEATAEGHLAGAPTPELQEIADELLSEFGTFVQACADGDGPAYNAAADRATAAAQRLAAALTDMGVDVTG